MCPFCFGTLGLVVAGTISTGGLTALAMKISCKNNNPAEPTSNANTRSNENDKTDSR